MQTTLDAYLLRLDNWLDADLCREAVAAVESGDWRPHTYTGTGEPGAHSLSGEQELEISFAGGTDFNKAISRKVALATEFYSVRLQFPWLPVSRHHTPVRYNRYSTGQLMLEHCDHIQLFDDGEKGVPILSCLMMLNDDYGGGELIMWGDQVIPTRAGTTLVFPSNFLFPHRVEPVTSGNRYSCISWAW